MAVPGYRDMTCHLDCACKLTAFGTGAWGLTDKNTNVITSQCVINNNKA